MKALLIGLAVLLATLAALPHASAQQTGAVTVHLQAPTEAVREDGSISFSGTVTFVSDYTAVTSLMGVPVQYMVTAAPEWASVVVSPASDVFPLPAAGASPSYVATRTFTITVAAGQELPSDVTSLVQITATTTPGLLGKSFSGRGETLVHYDAPEHEDCPEGYTTEEVAAMAAEAADAYNAYQRDQSSSDDVTVQNAAASRLSVPWAAVAGFALVGAAVGLVLRRRLG